MSVPAANLPSEDKTVLAARAAIARQRKGIRALLPFLGPAFIAAVAYIDPGNYATNIQSGSEFGYKLLWVVVLANVMAMLIQNMSAKLGIATGKNLPEMCRAHFPKWLSYLLWGFSEVAAMATDIAEFLGATLGLNLLFHIPMLIATLITGVATYLILMLDRFGFRPLEKFISALVIVIALCYLVETFLSKPHWSQVAYHSFVPWISGNSDAVLLVVGVIGATVMPHVVYLHSSLTKDRIVPRDDTEKKRIFGFSTREVIIAMTLAGLINLSMMYMAASVFHAHGQTQVADIPTAYKTLTPLLGPASAAVFLVSLLSSGFSSSAVGTMAGQVIMQGFVGFTIPLWIRRVVTMIPTVIIVVLGINPTQTLVISQVILSLVLPAPIISLIYFTRRKDIMGVLTNRRIVTYAATACAVVIVFLNLVLIYQTLGGPLPV
ncbi:Nramp family divalent metal transporter [Alicyclobacillus cycloheptanicus]|uniref:Divalent metal cation transporter MntH n=1 Tax=Alicyclobacillus cycloheptanicus TaxID=1457 RepID=A0ABT9XMW6_9BACL|nr:Nramp family divalent metal transporter [Alicyclobacillus cycloheptanicus]MDQ0191374.1 manganese transport protein [Alicyclobacillus cycloheptanicus]WDM02361.1 Nramp family divalent metal transporter [Alicyclobacillus cycloheptanicus]